MARRNMIDAVLNTSKSEASLAALLDEAREYAQIYLLARQRHKGCEGTGVSSRGLGIRRRIFRKHERRQGCRGGKHGQDDIRKDL